MSNGLVYRYDVRKSDDGVGGEEGTFCLCTLWCVFFFFLSFYASWLQPRCPLTCVGTLMWRMFDNCRSISDFLTRCVEALTRAGEVDRRLLPKAINMFEVRGVYTRRYLSLYSCILVLSFRISFST
ncbi:glycoside hydrolase family 15 protein [Hebeloma cylindrosporum]|uniref:Glycoside hydrolase family 15 protein n=1 Tax=Hebeloma cylindrosporum TaxID=76867 RepID=A0A0C3BIG5_HEBCY|nr:glycoside hydrolase family 15 protein [Hebeloma cylindrosporum h7]